LLADDRALFDPDWLRSAGVRHGAAELFGTAPAQAQEEEPGREIGRRLGPGGRELSGDEPFRLDAFYNVYRALAEIEPKNACRAAASASRARAACSSSSISRTSRQDGTHSGELRELSRSQAVRRDSSAVVGIARERAVRFDRPVKILNAGEPFGAFSCAGLVGQIS
jgi:hypothetical protein